MKEVTCGKIKISDVKLQYYEKGRGKEKVIVIFHGNGMNTTSFKKLFLELSKEHHVIGIDTRGHGKSEIGKKVLSIELFAKDFTEFFKVKKLKKPCIIGFSDGANISMVMCKKYGDEIDKVVLISGNYKAEGLKLWGTIIIKLYINLLKILGLCHKKFKGKALIAELMVKDIGIEKKDLEKIKNKVLVLCARNDVIKLKHSIEISRFIKNSKIIEIKKSNHLNIINKNETIEEIRSFLKEERS
ncbi:MAG: alpha/beta fold hydrolase [Clostridium sp.]|uniref:alpha/beta fold hydrolase n=1 Tax=Clostridium sp. TaxID=1506 RepID=UPI003F40148F